MADILLPAERINVAAEADLCVIGGSCTGVFAAVRAARLGAKVILLERQNRFGGLPLSGLSACGTRFMTPAENSRSLPD